MRLLNLVTRQTTTLIGTGVAGSVDAVATSATINLLSSVFSNSNGISILQIEEVEHPLQEGFVC